MGEIPDVKINESELMVTLPHNDASIRLYSGDNYERMRGLYFDGVVIDEVADIDPRAWPTVIRPTLTDYKGWATFIGTPKGRNVFYDVYCTAKESDEWYDLFLPASDSGILDPEELQAIHDDPTVTESAYLQEYECDFSIAAPGAIYLDLVEKARNEGRLSEDVCHFEGLPVYTTFDVGAAVNTICWIWQVVGDRVKFLQSLQGGKGLETPAQWVKLLGELSNQRGYSYGMHFMPHDGETYWVPAFKEAGVQNVESLVRPSKEWDPINETRRTFPRISINIKECESGVRALEHWASKEMNKGAYIDNKPAHDWASHWCTAFGYASWAIKWGRTVNKAAQPVADRTNQRFIRPRVQSGLRY